jgi:hypothetical protein
VNQKQKPVSLGWRIKGDSWQPTSSFSSSSLSSSFSLLLYLHKVIMNDRLLHQGPQLRTLNPEFNPEFTPRIFNIKRGVNLGLNRGYGVLRFGLRWAAKKRGVHRVHSRVAERERGQKVHEVQIQ